MSSNIDLLIVLLLIFLNGLFVMSEMAIVSVRKVRLQQQANQGSTNARVALDLANAPNQFLPTVQIGITLLAILSGAFGESSVSRRLEPVLQLIPSLAPYSQAISSVIAVLTITYLTLIIGELVPKRLALNNPEPIAASVAIPMRMLSKIGAPAVYLLSYSTDLILRIMGIVPSTEPQVTEEEIKVLIEQGTEAGTFEEAEQEMVERVFRLGDRRVSALMTPRPDLVWLDLEDSVEKNRQKMLGSGHSRFPVCQGGLDNVLGLVHVTDMLSRNLTGQELDLSASLRRPLFVPESTRGLKVLELFKQSSNQIALVVDEYGVIQGLVTVNDILVELVGDLPSVEDADEPQAVQREDGSWLLDGMLPVEDFFEIFGIEDSSSEHKGSYHTMGGFVITNLGKIPTAAEHFEWNHLRVEVVDMDGNRVDKVLVMPIEPTRDRTASESQA
ncbi:MAG: HlyC/CorC family transporter [Oscillatoriales cyanobacterium RU_3_3]|nr:HlyC/CorC family transporter [Microcoleus sp. SU_5_6]NJM60485.1 HlyC/CorC family transporter [Oscillatoriales cyanobacterium RU_3_3]NJR24153.1 HlyC/CorC family transporter [Richelia sp. CSU_2_1]